MSTAYQQLLQATIEHLARLKGRGQKTVQLDSAWLARLQPNLPPAPLTHSQAGAAKHQPPPRIQAPANAQTLPPQIPRTRDDLSPQSSPPPPTTIPAPPPSPAAAPIHSSNLPAPLVGPDKLAALAALREQALNCVRCPHLANSRHSVVFGVGTFAAELMFVGEAPGADEDAAGEPFVGKAGQLLTRIIQTMGLSRETVYIGNVLKCRPDTPGQTSGNRKPTPAEMSTCLPYLEKQIDLIRPKVLVALGATAVEGLLSRPVMITKLRGQWQQYRGIALMPTYHPSYLLRNQALATKREVWEDMLQVMERLGLPISDKQRQYFLPTA